MKIYSPEITHSAVYFPRNGKKPYLRYNHCVDIIHFKGKFYAAWNANQTGSEGVPGQYNFLSVSDDFKHWSGAEKLFPEIPSDRQWQPEFIKDGEKTLYCAWCDTETRITYVSSTSDGKTWKHQVISSEGIPENTVAFPTNHGLLSKNGSFYFPVSFAPTAGGDCLYAGTLISNDRGGNWFWSRPVRAMTYSELGIDVGDSRRERPPLWEPMIYDVSDGKLGMLIRHSINTDEEPSVRTEHMMLYSESTDGGITWTEARTVEMQTICSRCYAERTENGLFMVMNDHQRGIPQAFANDRYHLALWCGPDGDPDLLLPGPEVQPEGGRAFYPNGFIEDGKLYCAYTYPDYIASSVIGELPDLTQEFLLPRAARGRVIFENDGFILLHPQASVGLFIPEKKIRAEKLSFFFTLSSTVRDEKDFPILTLGGKTRSGALVFLRFDQETEEDSLFVRTTDGKESLICSAPLKVKLPLEVTLEKDSFTISGKTISFPLMRKISFGGLYENIVYPMVQEPVRNHVSVSSIRVR